MSNIIDGNGGGRDGAATAITVALILMMASSPAILTTTTEATTISGGNAYCNDIQFRTFESATYYSKLTDDTITIETSQGKYSVDIDYYKDSGTEVVYYKNVAAEDPPGNVLLPAGEIITITLPHDGALFDSPTRVTLYNDEVTDCETFRGEYVDATDKMALEIISIEEGDELPGTAKLTVRVPDASEVVKDFTKLNVQFPYGAEVQEYYLISDSVQVLPPSITCEGQTATIVGTSGNDNNIRGSSGRDVIAALGGNDRISALSGNDIVCGGAGADTVDGGAGADRLIGDESGSSSSTSGGGIDRIVGGTGNDYINGGARNDFLDGSSGNDEVHGSSGNDEVLGSTGTDRLYGEENDDRLDGGSNRDNGDGGTGFDGCVRVETVTNCEA
jgi:Ca2+-binding RTX toxin-like protein